MAVVPLRIAAVFRPDMRSYVEVFGAPLIGVVSYFIGTYARAVERDFMWNQSNEFKTGNCRCCCLLNALTCPVLHRAVAEAR